MIFDFNSIDYKQNILEDICLGNIKEFRRLVNIVFKNILDLYDDYNIIEGVKKPSIEQLLSEKNMIHNYELFLKVKKHLNYIVYVIRFKLRLALTNEMNLTSFVFQNAHDLQIQNIFYSINGMLEKLEQKQKKDKTNICILVSEKNIKNNINKNKIFHKIILMVIKK